MKTQITTLKIIYHIHLTKCTWLPIIPINKPKKKTTTHQNLSDKKKKSRKRIKKPALLELSSANVLQT